MKHIFYFIAIIPIIWELKCLYDTEKVSDFSKELSRLRKTDKKIEDYTRTQQSYLICMTGYFVWCFIGFFTFQWSAFLTIFALSFIPKNIIWIRWLNSFVTLLILIYILLNAYHFKINMWELINI